MGIYSDTYEDNAERQDPWSATHFFGSAFRGRAPLRVQPTAVMPCPSCSRLFTGRDALGAHLFASHRADRFYLRVNGRPSGEFLIVAEPLTSALVIPLGSQTIEVRVAVDGQHLGSLSALANLETELIHFPVDAGLVTIDCLAPGRRRSFEIYVMTMPQVDTDPLDALVREAQDPLLRGEELDVSFLYREIQKLRPQSMERRYLEGLYEYLHALVLERKGQFKDAGHALERAWGRLLPFGTDLARSAMAVVAFRLDAHTFLVDPATESMLAPYAAYLLSPPELRSVTPPASIQNGIWIDDYQEGLLAAIRHAVAGEPHAVLRALDTAPAMLRKASGNTRKTLIIRARNGSAANDAAGARAAYSALTSDPVYGNEAMNVISGLN